MTAAQGAAPLPNGTVDTHFHVLGPPSRYPYAEGRSYTPPDADFADWRRLSEGLGVGAGVLVQASVHGFDNSQILDLLRARPFPLRAVLALRPDIGDARLADLHALGVRGARINTVFNAGMGLEAATALARRLRGSGWHLEFLADVSRIPDLRGLVAGLGVPAVFAHFGHVPAAQALADPGFRALCGLVRDGLAWVKLSGPARITAHDAPPYGDAAPLARALVQANPDRLLWGSDWPHTAIPRPPPGHPALAAMARDWLDCPALLAKVMVANPRNLYDLGESA